jgi:hypothetical protein
MTCRYPPKTAEASLDQASGPSFCTFGAAYRSNGPTLKPHRWSEYSQTERKVRKPVRSQHFIEHML